MTNRQWLAGLSDEKLVNLMRPIVCPPGQKCAPWRRCPPDKLVGCLACWKEWLGRESDKPTTAIYDIIEEHHGCFVQVLKNSITGEMSVGWKENK